jgi:tetratricopeptide (TPR) repeat protein
MSIKFPEFVGRVDQLSQIEKQIARRGETAVVNIAGAGGVGKTAILQQVKKAYEKQPGVLVTDVIDFFHTVHRVESWVLDRLTVAKEDGFPNYREKMREIEGLEPVPRLYGEREALETFISDYNHLAGNYRLILLFDTVELVQETPLLEFILDLIARLRNTVLILAGRFNDNLLFVERLNKDFGADRVLTFRLAGFTEEEAKLYFEQADVPRLGEVNEALRKNIYLLSDGNAIKIALSLEWLNRGIPLMSEITRMEPADLEKRPASDLATLQTKFEYALMDGIRNLESLLSEVVLYMAHLHKRFNRKMLDFFFLQDLDQGARDQQATELISQLRDVPFVKYVNDDYFVLHDEMTRLVTQYVWDSAEDPDKTLRRELSSNACEYYCQELSEFPLPQDRTEQQRVTFWSYSVESMYYKLYSDFRSGYEEFEELFEKLVDDHRPGLAALAVQFLREFRREAEFSDLLACFLDGYYDGGVLLSQQRFREAERTLTEGEKRLNEIISTLALEQVSPLDRHLSERLYEVYHQLGFCYRSMGDWDSAIENYNKSLGLALEAAKKIDKLASPSTDRKKFLMAQIAETLNSLSNVHRLRGNLHDARLFCKTSILLRQTWDPVQVAKSHYVMGMVLWEMGATAEAMRYLRGAEQSCEPEDEGTQALIKEYQAYIRYRAGLPHLAMPILIEAISIFRRRGQFSELAHALITRSRIYREHPNAVQHELAGKDHMDAALKLAEEAHAIADRIGDQYRLAECHLTLSLNFYRSSQSSQLYPARSQEYRRRALEHYEQGVELSRGRYYQILSLYSAVRGDIAFDEENYDLAFDEYARRCELATRFKLAVYERAIDTLGDRLRTLGTKDAMLAKRYADRILEFWRREPQREAHYSELIDEINEIKNAIEERETLDRLGWQYDQAMLKGRWGEAIECCNRILEIPSLYSDVGRANVILDKIRATHQQGALSEARRLCKVVLQIGMELNSPELIGNAHLSLARVLWDTTSTAEAAFHLSRAEEAFQRMEDKLNGKIGLARVRRHRSYIRHRTGFFQESMDELANAVQVFRENGLDSELADVWNVMSRIARTNPSKPNPVQAREYAERALQKALSANDSYRIAECHLSLAILAYRERKLDETLQHCDAGLDVLSPETHLLRSVYRGIQGYALFERGSGATDLQSKTQYWEQAFESFILELAEATKSKPARLIRALDLIHDRLMDIPVEEITKYTSRIEEAWQESQLAQEFDIVIRMCEQAIQYRPYIQIDSN